MTKRMLIDATHAEETRVVVLDGNRLDDFDVETSTKKQLKGNIYLAKVIRVEPSLQAAFVEYGGGRHGFLAFSEIHPDYYQIPVADRQRLLEMQAQEAREEEEAEERAASRHAAAPAAAAAARMAPEEVIPDHAAQDHGAPEGDPAAAEQPWMAPQPAVDAEAAEPPQAETAAAPHQAAPEMAPELPPERLAQAEATSPDDDAADAADRPAQAMAIEPEERYGAADAELPDLDTHEMDVPASDMPPPETIGGETDGGDGGDEARARRSSRFLRNYRIQEVIKRRQIMLVQVVKEERGTKGAALTSYISLAGRFCVLMPNSPRGGGISRKITSAADRRRLKEITAELEIPQGMGLIVRTAGANRPKPEIRRDCEYLMRLWDDIREHTMRSVAPALIYEEASLIKRAIRDVYSRDVDEIIVDGEDGWRGAHEFMRMLMPSHAKKVQLWRGDGGGPPQPLFARFQVEAQLDAILAPTVQLRSGGYLVINQTEALVAIDVNSGRSTRERGIEETALRTNMEAAEEVARQLRLRDLAGLIVIDFIDMEARKHNAMVERRLKDALKIDRARIQVGHISHFGLLEMSRQRLRPSLAETSFITCPHCAGLGQVRSTESGAIHVMREIEEEGAKGRAALIRVQAAASIVLYLLNHKRDRLGAIEARYGMRVHFEPDDTLVPPQIRIERIKPQNPDAVRAVIAPVAPAAPAFTAEEEDVPDLLAEEEAEANPTANVEAVAAARPAAAPAAGQAAGGGAAEARTPGEEAEHRRRRRRRRRGGRRDGSPENGPENGSAENGGPELAGDAAGDDETGSDSGEDGGGAALVQVAPAEAIDDGAVTPAEAPPPLDPSQAEQPEIITAASTDEEERGRRRGRRGGRRRRRDEPETEAATPPAAPVLPVQPVYSGPTPADPFGGAFDIFDLMDQEPPPAPPPPPRRQPAAIQQAVALPVAEPAPEPVAVAAPVDDAAVAHAPVVETPVVETPVAETPVVAAAEPEAAIKPILVGEDDAPAQPKRGWWR